MNDIATGIVIDHDYRTSPRPLSPRHRVGTKALVAIAWILASVLIALMLMSGALTACAQLRCWTL